MEAISVCEPRIIDTIARLFPRPPETVPARIG
jgi:hypothetical protein